jgi:hypothetical protein
MRRSRRPRPAVLLLYWNPPESQLRATIDHHIHALRYSALRPTVMYYNAYSPPPNWLRRIPFDAVIFHTTFLCMRWSHLFPTWKWKLRWLNETPWRKIAIPQDEYDHSEVLDEWLLELGVDVVLSNFESPSRHVLYPLMRSTASFEHVLTGYVDRDEVASLQSTLRPHSERPLDIVYRASQLPYWFGSHGQLKHQIGSVVAAAATSRGMQIDISTRPQDTIVGRGWFDFLGAGRVVIGCESGSSVLDRRGEIRAAVQALLAQNPAATFDEIDANMPAGWDSHRFFAISPRHFEAVATRTCQVLVEGDYDGILVPHRHYIPLRRDFSNLDEVLGRIEDVELTQSVADRAFDDIIEHGRFDYAQLAAVYERHLPEPRHATLRRACLRAAVLATEARDRPAQLAARAVAVRTLLSPRLIARVLMTLWLVICDPPLRRLLRRAIRRRPAPLDRLLADVLRLALLRRIARGVSDQRNSIRRLDLNDSVLFVSEGAKHAPPSTAATGGGGLRQIAWVDHADEYIRAPRFLGKRFGVAVGTHYRFEALEPLLLEDPELVLGALPATSAPQLATTRDEIRGR